MSKSEAKALIETYAKQTGKPTEEVAAEIAALFGYQKTGIPLPASDDKMSPMMQAILESQKIEREMGAAGKGEVSPIIKMMMETVTMMPLMKMMGGMGGQGQENNVNDLLNKNDEKWERRLASIEAKAEKDALQRQLDDMKSLILSSSGSKKDELTDKFDKLSEKLDAEKEKRFADALDNKGAEITQLREDMTSYLEDMRNQPTAKGADEGFFEIMTKMNRFDEMIRQRGKSLGMTDDEIGKTVAGALPLKQQIIKDAFKTLNRGIDAWAGKTTEDEETEEPEIAEEPDPAEKAARRKGEIPAPAEETQPAPAPEEILNIS